MASAFQFISAQEHRLTSRLTRASAGTGAIVVLDLEDSLWDVTDESRTSALKRAGRDDLLALASQHGELWSDQRIGVRVNRLSSEECSEDLRVLAEASQRVTFECVVPTKVESGADLERWLSLLNVHRVAHRGLVPIIETATGIANLAEIATTARRLGVAWLVYGYYDHMLDAGTWPFHDHADPAFWLLVEPIIDLVERAGLRYVHPPFFRLNALGAFKALLDRLARICRSDFGVISLGTRQTVMAQRHVASLDSRPVTELDPAVAEVTPHDRARRVVEAFTAKRHSSLSFAIEPRTGEFISPHLYLAARRFLDGG